MGRVACELLMVTVPKRLKHLVLIKNWLRSHLWAQESWEGQKKGMAPQHSIKAGGTIAPFVPWPHVHIYDNNK